MGYTESIVPYIFLIDSFRVILGRKLKIFSEQYFLCCTRVLLLIESIVNSKKEIIIYADTISYGSRNKNLQVFFRNTTSLN